MKATTKYIAAIALSVASISANATNMSAASREDICISISRFAGIVADGRREGLVLDTLLEKLEGNGKDHSKAAERARKATISVTNYVYTMELNSVDARKLVYLKCGAGTYD